MKQKGVYDIKQAAVIGAGVMGSGIAAHLANAGIQVLLLDIVPDKLSDEEKKKGLTLEDKEVRNRFALKAKARMEDKRSTMLYTKENIKYLTFGNIEDDLEKLREADWVIEAVIENQQIKQDVYKKIEPYLKDNAILSSNTSGISINALSEGLNEKLKARFLGTHFFNPPRYMKLVEIIPSKNTSKDTIELIMNFCERKLGKGVVQAKDTPGFIANRVGVYALGIIMHKILEYDLSFEEADALTGVEIGRPKTGTFRLLDIIGIDTLTLVAEYLKENVTDAKEKEILKMPEYVKEMVRKNLLGDKVKSGFYKKEGKETLVLNHQDFSYRSKEKIDLAELNEIKKIKDFGKKLNTLVYGKNKLNQFVWDVIKETLLFSAKMVPEISDDIVDIDNAMKWGYNWEVGPFELWDIIGVKKSVDRMKAEGEDIPPIVSELINSGKDKFYDEKQLDLSKKRITPLNLYKNGRSVIKSDHISLFDMGDDVACMILHSPNSSITDQVVEFTHQALKEVEVNYKGVIFASVGKNFCVGANLPYILENSRAKNWKAIENLVTTFQGMNMALKYSNRPVIAAPYAMTLGGGAEIVLHAHKVRGFAELYMGLVEVGVGLLPAGGGTKELLLRSIEDISDNQKVDLTPFVTQALETIIFAKVSSSEPDAKMLGYLRKTDEISMNKDYQLYEAKQDVLQLAKGVGQFDRNRKYRVGGTNLLATLKFNLYQMYRGGFISEYDMYIAKKIAHVLCGGELPSNSMVDEQHILDLEKEAFLSLCGEEKTHQRIEHMLKTGRPLRN
ncbi:MAG: 3-hydroxyacyl-CoA dehydrogenase [Syntrophomonadaceae bacterium]|nr:3-hydroxyacyl-CoA dehydrogenase [Syntrophomonadaceae bacterium]